ncbi:MAG TPA: hypothetical protein VF181_00880 [Balneolaceae bacterium]
MENYSKYPKGSEWRKWDLHIHTPVSIKQNYGGPDKWDKFIDALEHLPKEIKVIGINDYYFIDGYEKVMEYKREGRLDNIDKIFPVLEFRIDTFGSGNENKLQKINLHIIFDIDESKIEDEVRKIKKEFIEQIPITKLEKHKTKCLSKENLIIEGGNDLHKGFSDLIPPTEKVFELVNNTIWKDKVFLLLGYKEWSNLEKNNQLKPLKEDLYEKVSAFFTSNSQTLEKSKKWLDEYGDKALLHSCDIHGFDILDTAEKNKDGEYLDSKAYHCHTWIKADPTFEGLKQIAYEPTERVVIQETKPDEKKLYDVIDKVQFEDTDSFMPTEIQINNNLTTIIGGKSTGKSILIRNIAKSIDKVEFNNRNKAVNITENKPLRGFKVFWNDGQISELNNQNNPDKRVIYIPQSYLNRIVESDETNTAVDEIIKDVLLQDEDYSNWNDKLGEDLKQNNQSIRSGVSKLFELFEQFKNLTKEIKEVGDGEGIAKQISKLKKEVKELQEKSDIEEEELARFDELSERIRKSRLYIEQLESDIKVIEQIKEEAVEINTSSHELIQLSKTRLEINQLVEKKEKEYSKDWKESVGKKISSLKEKLSTERKKLETDKSDIDSLSAKVKDRKALAQKTNELDEERKREDLIKKLNKEREEIAENIKSITGKLAEFVSHFYSIMIKAKDHVDLESFDEELQFDILTVFSKSAFQSRFVEQFFDGRKLRGEEWDFLTQFEFKSKEEYRGFVKKIINQTISGKLPIRGNIEKQEVLDSFLRNWFSHDYQVVYQGDELEDMSPGKKSFVLLRLLIDLDHSKCPILIDQPEDDLDNRSIYTQVVNFLREKKKERQIIIVTHNPNLVLGADAELIIVANQEGNDTQNRKYHFEYVSGSIEFTKKQNDDIDEVLYKRGVQEHICEILEGGEEAFNKRKNKYSFSK